MKLESGSKKASQKQKEKPKESNDDLLKKFPNIFQIADRGKLVCTLTKHELPPNELCNYVVSKKFLWEWKIHQIMEQYGEHFDSMGPGVLACRVTLRTVARDPADLERHVNGKRFTKELPIYLEKKEAEKQKELEKQQAAEQRERDAIAAMQESDTANTENKVEKEEAEVKMESDSPISEHMDSEIEATTPVSQVKKRKAKLTESSAKKVKKVKKGGKADA
uniref:Surfeit locus protein 2 n=1 Tax=Ditylenchus dipsaci TaxID=166011 RepID=A0A915EDF1_9BILA